jgi:hypothetical protein
VSGSTITITNTSDYEITIRYAVCSADKSGFTSGGSKILLRDNDGAQDYVQIKRPGSSDTSPSLNDIMIDTRLSYLPILDEGYLTYPDDFTALTGGDRYKGNMVASVSFENPDGILPFVKCGVVFAGDDSLELKLGNNTNPLHPITYWGSHKIGYGGSWDNRCEGTSTWAEIVSDTSVNFYASGTNPFFYSGGSTASFGSDVVGLRYYIFGIPSDL